MYTLYILFTIYIYIYIYTYTVEKKKIALIILSAVEIHY